MAKVIVHIGLPKTATTSLQIDVFSKLRNIQDINYVGIYQPRKDIQTELFKKFYYYLLTGKDINEIIDLIKIEIEKGRNILISEEMIVGVSAGDTSNDSWRQKIHNLSLLLQNFDYKVIVTVREPSKALFSYYVEGYHIFKKLNQSFLEVALTHECMKIFHYGIFFNYLLNYFPKHRISVYKFEEIIKNQYSDLFSILEIPDEFSDLKLNDYNFKKQKKKFIIKQRNVSFPKSLIKFLPNNVRLNFLLFFNKYSGLKWLFNDYVRVPTEKEFQELRGMLKEETEFLKRTFGVKY